MRRAGPGAAGDRLAHHPRQHRRGRRLPRAGRRHARQAQHGRQADDADRGRRGLRALRPRPRLEQSTMPQKRNPISSCYIHAAISVVRQHAAALMDAMVADHERSTGPWEIEWIVLPEAFCLMAGALKQARSVVEGLEVDAERDAPQHRHDQRAGDVRGGDDGPGPLHRPRVRPRPGLRHLPRGAAPEPPAARPAGRAPGDQQAPRPRRAGEALRSRPTTSASPASWSTACSTSWSNGHEHRRRPRGAVRADARPAPPAARSSCASGCPPTSARATRR